MSSPAKYQPLAALPGSGNNTRISQATAVEQQRAIAEVQAAVVVAQQVPRDMSRAEAEMKDVCGRLSMANSAFYAVPNRGNGPSVHLMRELARIWGNLDYGVRELRRDDAAEESEIQAFAWDIQTNTRSTRTFIVPHARMKAGNRQKLIDLGDIYLNNQNIGARAVRECISTVLPRWFAEQAIDICEATLEHGEGEPLPARIDKMVNAFRTINVSTEQIETKLGRQHGSWTAADVARMGVVYRSIKAGDAIRDEEFPPLRAVSTDDIIKPVAEPEPEPASEPEPDAEPKQDEAPAVAESDAEPDETPVAASHEPRSQS
ncbi:hypothetical protein [Williamsia sp. DF01-3]|uniref:hypothetical protein n=1 Tax=Williamsia sp. DF01-3 TaxID=2934157 RepID=UPI001FF32835|nr:hypothetical protein [Williamsia sp. DF01-3]MCK0517902.1 hypothetical protein [Williamsia sp. DF01-3]